MTASRGMQYCILIAVCAWALYLGLPTLCFNLNDPNMIVYMNADEGGLMDEVWYYFSGQKRDSFQWDFDYGLEMMYVADFVRFFIAPFKVIKPGDLIFILRSLHLAAWIACFFFLWRLIGRHFRKGWQQVIAILLLASRPAFAYLSNNLKPEALILLLVIISLDYTLRIVDTPFKKRNFFIAVAFAAIAFIVKYAGIFILPAIITAIILIDESRNRRGLCAIFPYIKASWALPLMVGVTTIALCLTTIFLYVRKSTGFTWYAQYGLWGTLSHNTSILNICLAGSLLIGLSVLILLLNMSTHHFFRKISSAIKKINSYSLLTAGVFAAFIIIFGFRWVITPQHFINTYAQLGPIASVRVGNTGQSAFFTLSSLRETVRLFDPVVLSVFLFYLAVEVRYWRQSLIDDQGPLCKRFILAVYLAVPFALMFCVIFITQHQMLPFFTVALVLALQGISIFLKKFRGTARVKNYIVVLCVVLGATDILTNGADVMRSRIYQFHQHEDVAFEIAKWWRSHIPIDAKIVAGSRVRVYIPPEYKNVKTLKWNEAEDVEKLRQLINDYEPQFIYYNEGHFYKVPTPSIQGILPEGKTRRIGYFENKGRRYKKPTQDIFVIYEVLR